jgi:hypothetical protein
VHGVHVVEEGEELVPVGEVAADQHPHLTGTRTRVTAGDGVRHGGGKETGVRHGGRQVTVWDTGD